MAEQATRGSATYERRLLDEVIDAYTQWRIECRRVRESYHRWSNARGDDARLGFAACMSALDREESSAKWLQATTERLGGSLAEMPLRELPTSY